MKDDERRPQRECKRRLGWEDGTRRGGEGRGKRRLLEGDEMQANRLRER